MKTIHQNKLTALLALAALLFALGGCSETPTGPGQDPGQTAAPTLPNPDLLVPDLEFLLDGTKAEVAGKENFFHAAVRAFAIDLMVKLHLAPPVAAFSLALHTPPSQQPDGSWTCIYTNVNGPAEYQIRLHGEDAGDTLAYDHDAPECSMVFTDASAGEEYFIRRNEVDGSGSLRVPDYNDGQEACWDHNQNNVDCNPTS